jgi:hypothetical protein
LRLFPKVDGIIDRLDRAALLTHPFDLDIRPRCEISVADARRLVSRAEYRPTVSVAGARPLVSRAQAR